jgi:hypothetical protein
MASIARTLPWWINFFHFTHRCADRHNYTQFMNRQALKPYLGFSGILIGAAYARPALSR